MAETAAHLVDHVLPPVPVRQWVLTLPFALRYLVAFDADLLADVRRPSRTSGSTTASCARSFVN